MRWACAVRQAVLPALMVSMVAAPAIDGDSENEMLQQTRATPPYFQTLQTRQVESATTLRWTEFGPAMSGYCDKYFQHPTDPNSQFMSMDMGNAYYTHDNGLSWTTSTDWDSNGENQRPMAMDFSRQDPDFGVAVLDKGKLGITENRGKQWNETDYLPNLQHGSLLSTIACDPRNDNNWYIGSGQYWRVKNTHRSAANLTGTQSPNTDYGHIFVSKDRARTWSIVSIEPMLDVAKIWVDPESSNVVFAVTNLGFYKSVDGGLHWTKRGLGLPFNQPRDGDFYYDSRNKKLTLYLVEQTHYTPSAHPPDSISASGGVYKSTDRGESWHSITGNLAVDLTQINQYLSTQQYYRAIGYWFGISAAKTQQLYPQKPTAILTVFNRLVASKTRPNTLFVASNVKHDYSFGPGEVWRSTDEGKTWQAVARNGVYWVNETDKAYWQSRPGQELGMNMKYAHLDFEMRTSNQDAGVRDLLSKPDGDLIVVHEQQTLRSTDHGDSWVQSDDDETLPGSVHWVGRGGSNLPGRTIQTDTGKGQYLFASGEHGLWRGPTAASKSTLWPTAGEGDGPSVIKYGVGLEQITGESHAIDGATSVCAVAVHPIDHDTIYILMFRQTYRGMVRKSTDAGQSWRTISYPVQSNSSLSPNQIIQFDLLLSRSDPRMMYFTVPVTRYIPWPHTLQQRNAPVDFTDFGIYRSKDAGVTWSILHDNGLPPNGSVTRLAMDPHNSLIIYAAMNQQNIDSDPQAQVDGGLYMSTDGGDHWAIVEIPSEIVSVNHVSIDSNSGAIYIAAGTAIGDINAGGVYQRSSGSTQWRKLFFMPYVRECFASPLDPDLLFVNVGIGRKTGNINPGLYYSHNGGIYWTKANYKLGQPGRLMAIRPGASPI